MLNKELLEMVIADKARMLDLHDKATAYVRGKISGEMLILEMVERLKDDIIEINQMTRTVPEPIRELMMDSARELIRGLRVDLKELINVA
jgi:DNA repair exonuclease SbcCD nuclease subunit